MNNHQIKLDIVNEFTDMQKYFSNDLSNLEFNKINHELESLRNEINSRIINFNDEYREFIIDCVEEVLEIDHEADLLEIIVPLWANERGNIVPIEKSIDEFYYDVEQVMLWQMLLNLVSSTTVSTHILSKLRAIVRRYSTMPQLWIYLCNMSGDKLKTAYTF
jgi:hypothetical protein